MGRIIVGVDGSVDSAGALAWSATKAEQRGWSVTAVLAWTYLDQHHADRVARFESDYSEADALAALDSYIDDAVGPERGRNIERKPVNDLPAPALLDSAAGADLVVIGPRGLGGFRGMLLGSVSQHVVRHALCPTAIIRSVPESRGAATGGARTVVGVDGSDESRAALHWALEDAVTSHGSVAAIHSWHMPHDIGFPVSAVSFDPQAFEDAAHNLLAAALDAEADLISRLEAPVEKIVVTGDATSNLLDAAKDADLVVVGSRGRGGFSGLLLGSVSQQIALHAPCPVMVVPKR